MCLHCLIHQSCRPIHPQICHFTMSNAKGGPDYYKYTQIYNLHAWNVRDCITFNWLMFLYMLFPSSIKHVFSVNQPEFSAPPPEPVCECTEWNCKQPCDASMVRVCANQCDIEEKAIAEPCCKEWSQGAGTGMEGASMVGYLTPLNDFSTLLTVYESSWKLMSG